MPKYLHKLLLVLALGAGSLAQAAVIGFDNPELVDIDNDSNIATYRESGYAITGQAGSFLTLDGIGTDASGGLAVLSDGSIMLAATDGSAFSFTGFDAGALDPSTPGALAVTGFFANGAALDLLFVVTELRNYMLPDWKGLTSLRLTARGDVVLDTLVLDAQAVPEPGSIAMVLLGFAALVGVRRAVKPA